MGPVAIASSITDARKPGVSSTMEIISYYTCYTSTLTGSNLVQCWFDFTKKSGAWVPEHWVPYTSITDTALQSQCVLQFSRCYSSFLATGSVMPARTTRWTNGGGYVYQPSYANDWTFTASSPCCSSCSLSGGNVQVQYWPTPAPTPNVTALVDENGFTFVSPSVYVIFESLIATDLCGPVGETYYNKTLSFEPSALSTSQGNLYTNDVLWPHSKYIWTAFNYEDLTQANCSNLTSLYYVDVGIAFRGPTSTYSTQPPIYTDSSLQPYIETWTYIYNPCFPTMSVPTELFGIDMGWRSCLDGISAFYDPPRALKPAQGLTAVHLPTTHRDPEKSQHTHTAVNGATPTPQTPAATSTPRPDLKPSDPLYRPSLESSMTQSLWPIVHPSVPAATAKSHDGLDPAMTPNSLAVAIHIGGYVMTDGAPATTIEGKAVFYTSGLIHVDKTAITIPRINDPVVPTTMLAAGLTFSIGPSSGQSHDLPVPIIGSTVLTTNKASGLVNEGQTLTGTNADFTISGTKTFLDGSRNKATIGTTTEAWPLGSIIMNGFGNPSSTSFVTINGKITVSIDESQVMVSGTTFSLGQVQSSSTLVIGSQTYIIGSNDINAKATLSTVTADGLTFSMGKSQAIVSGTTNTLGKAQASSTLVIGGQTLILPNDNSAKATLTSFTASGVTFSIDRSQAIISGTTYSLRPTQSASTLVLDGQTFNVGPSGISAKTSFSPDTANGLTSSVDATQAIPSSSHPLESIQSASALVINGHTLTLGPHSISAKTTLSPYTTNGLTFSADASEAILSGTTYSIGPGASPTTLVFGNETVSIGPSGVGLASTTTALFNATGTGMELFTGHAPASIVARDWVLGVGIICVLVTVAIL